MGNISAEGNAAGANPATESYSYDPLYRLTAITDGSTTVESLTYNLTGDRLTKTGNGLGVGTYTYTSGTHQLNSIGTAARTADANGNTTASASAGQTMGYGYNGRNRLTVVQASSVTVGTYTYNAMGQRVQKVATSPTAITQRYAYDEQGHLIGEYTSATKRATIWLGDIPIATVDTAGSTSTVNYVTADQLGTPRAVSNASGATIWSWPYVANPFGELAPTSSNGYMLNLRYPGQYFDVETGLMYNGARYYESATGRYLQSDPMGLFGGQMSTYTYVGNNPLSYTDPLGLYCLKEWQIRGIAGAVTGAAAGGVAGSESGPGAIVSALAGGIINGGLGVIDGLTDSTQVNGAATGAMGAMLTSGNKGELGAGAVGGLFGGAVSAQMANDGYSRPVANGAGAAVGGSVGGAIYTFFKGPGKEILKGGLKGGGVGLAISLTQSGLEAALRAGNDCSCGK